MGFPLCTGPHWHRTHWPPNPSLIQSQAIILHPMALDPATRIFPQWWYLELRAGESEKEGSLGLIDQIPQVSETPHLKKNWVRALCLVHLLLPRPPVSPAPGDLTPPSGLLGTQHACGTQTDNIHTHKKKNK